MADERSLPSRVGAAEIIDFTEKAAYHPNSSEEDLRKRLKSPNKAAPARRACRALGLVSIEGETIEPTQIGKELAFEDTGTRRTLMLEDVVLGLDLYEIPLSRYVERDNDSGELLAEDLQRYWGVQVGLELSKDELSRAAATLLQLLEYCELGEYIIGRRGRSTRLEFSEQGEETLNEALEALHQERKERARSEHREYDPKQPQEEDTSSSNEEVALSGPSQGDVSAGTSPRPQPPEKSGYQVHASDDESVVIWIKPTPDSVQFLGAIHQMLENLHGDESGGGRTTSDRHSHQPHHEVVSGGDSKDE